MGLCSMTGYGYGQAGDEVVVTVEMRSVNHRYSEFFIRFLGNTVFWRIKFVV